MPGAGVWLLTSRGEVHPGISPLSFSATTSRLRQIGGSDLLKVAALVVVFTWFLFPRTTWYSLNDYDVWWHIRSGEWILQNHQLPQTDPFSITGSGKPWVAYSWPFGVLIYEVARNWDLVGVVGYTVMAWMAISAVMLVLLRTLGLDFWRAIALTAIGSVVLQRNVAPRPGTFTVFFFLLTLLILVRARRTGRTGAFWLLPVIIWAWANVHVQFLYGLFVIGVFCIEPLLNRMFRVETKSGIPYARLWAILGLSAVLTAVNPYGIGAYRVLFDFLREPRQVLYINEFHAMAFDRGLHFLVLFAFMAAVFVLGRRRIEPLWLVLLMWAAVMGFHMERDIWLVTMVSLAVIAQAWTGITDTVDRRVWLGATACVLLMLIGFFKIGPTNKQLQALVAETYPLGAVAYIHEHQLQGPIFNTFDWGGFLIYALPEFKVTIDGRTNVHGQDEIERSLRTWNVWPEWNTDPLMARANLVIGPPNLPLVQVLKVDPHFRLVFDDGVAVVLERVKE